MFPVDYDVKEYLICEISESELQHFCDDAIGFFERLPSAYFVRKGNILTSDKITTASHDDILQVVDNDIHLQKILIKGGI